MSVFMFATGIENSYPTIRLPSGELHRVDEMEKSGHYDHWQTDFRLVKEMGIRFLRYGPPYYKVNHAPGVYDWSFTDEVFDALKQMSITPIVDLCHFGVPDWLENFQNPDFPHHFREYVLAFAKRFPDLTFYTPINEMFIAAMFSAQYGWWNERLSDERSCVNALKNISKANLLAIQGILSVQTEAVFIQSESLEYFHVEDPYDSSSNTRAEFLNLKRFLPLDLTLGHPLSTAITEYLTLNGFSQDDFQWFSDHAFKGHLIIGTDYYVTNEHWVHANGLTSASGDIQGYYALAKEYHERYQKPLMHTETNMREPRSVEWLHKQWYDLYHLKAEGIPVLGFTWYSLTDQVDWDTALRENRGKVNPLGLFDLNRRIRPAGEAYKKLIHDWHDIRLDQHLPEKIEGRSLGEHLIKDFDKAEYIRQRKHIITFPDFDHLE